MEQQSKHTDSLLIRPTSSMKYIKTEQSPSRLPSLRGPRDLTLGGIKKKTFIPNIPVRKDRNKQEIKDEKILPCVKQEKRSRSRDGRSRGRGRGTRGKAIVQSHSIFEVRPDRTQASTDSHGRGKVLDVTSQMQKPTIKKEMLDSAHEKMASDAAMERLERGNNALIDDLQNDDKLRPIELPLHRFEMDGNGGDTAEAFRPTGNSHLILLQIPDSLPGIPPSSDDPSAQAKSDSQGANIDATHLSDRCSIDALPEGKIGKLQVFKSGRCRLLLKGVYLDLCLGTPTSFTQEIASVRLPPEGSLEGSAGHFSVLGEVSQKIVCVPNITTLINSA